MEKTLPVFAINRLRVGTDGEGITTLVGVHGCPLRCTYCINQMVWDSETLVRPFGLQELYEEVKIDNLYFQASGGGVTFGGGEALLHASFIRSFKEQYAKEWRVVLETSLQAPRSCVEEAIQGVDFFIVDCKDMNATIYEKYTKQPAKLMQDNLVYLLQEVGPERIMVRVPYIPEYNTREDTEKSIEQLKHMGITKIDSFDYIIDWDPNRFQGKTEE